LRPWKPKESQTGAAALQTEIGTPDAHLLTAECILNNAYTPQTTLTTKKLYVHALKKIWL